MAADKAKASAELSRLQAQVRRSKQERDQLDNLLTASTHKHAQQDYQLQKLQVKLWGHTVHLPHLDAAIFMAN